MSAELIVETSILDRLRAELKSWADEMDAFRYEMFHKRLMAAEYGRQDAVEWALSWFRDLQQQEAAAAAERMAQAACIEATREKDRAAYLTGRCGNPHYQAFLDTVESLESLEDSIKTNINFMAWIAQIVSANENSPSYREMNESERRANFRKLLLAARDANLAKRLGGTPSPLKF